MIIPNNSNNNNNFSKKILCNNNRVLIMAKYFKTIETIYQDYPNLKMGWNNFKKILILLNNLNNNNNFNNNNNNNFKSMGKTLTMISMTMKIIIITIQQQIFKCRMTIQ